MPSNYLIIGALREFDAYLGSDVKIENPTGSGQMMSLGEVADDLSARLIATFLPGPDGRRPIYHDNDMLGDASGLAGSDHLPGVFQRRHRCRPSARHIRRGGRRSCCP